MDTTSNDILIFAGTSEGHELARFLAVRGMLSRALFSVATEYGAEELSDVSGISVIVGRKNVDEIFTLIANKRFKLIIDATHPYAFVASENIRHAANKAGITYLRLLRPTMIKEAGDKDTNLRIVSSTEEARSVLDNCYDRFLLTTGTKDLSVFMDVQNFSGRAVARVLPLAASLKDCFESGLSPKSIICMQGPFSHEMNLATMKQFDLSLLVTKSTGKAGGFYEKIALANDGYKVMIIDHPDEKDGISIEEIKERLKSL